MTKFTENGISLFSSLTKNNAFTHNMMSGDLMLMREFKWVANSIGKCRPWAAHRQVDSQCDGL